MYALGGISEIGRNMTVFEYDGKLLIIDCGVLFPSSGEPGVDLILPDFGPIEKKIDKVEALVVTRARRPHWGYPMAAEAAARYSNCGFEIHFGVDCCED